MRSVHVLSLLVSMCLMGCLDSGPERELTGRDGEIARQGFNDAVKSARLVDIDVGGMADGLAAGSSLQFTMPGSGQVELVIQTVQQLLPGITTFSGRLADDENSDFTFSIEAGKLVGSIRRGTQAWLVEPHTSTDRSDRHMIRTIDRTMLPKDEPTSTLSSQRLVTAAQGGTDQHGSTSAIMSTGDVRVLFLYASDVSNAHTHAANIVAAFNNSLSLSAVAPNNYLTVAGVQPVGVDFDNLSREMILNAMVARAAPFNGIDAALDSAAADIAFLLVSEDAGAIDVTNFGRVGGVARNFQQANPFALSTVSYALGDLTALHEIGHVFGGRHENATGTSARPVVAIDDTWMTVMGGYIDCPFTGLGATCVRLNRWSNPDQTYLGIPLGVAGQSDMESHLEGSMPAVSNWRADSEPATLTSPAPGSTLPGATAMFSWTTGIGVSQYYLYVGSSVAGSDLYASTQGLSTSGTVSGLPTDGRTIYVRLWSLTGGGWQSGDYTYTAASVAGPAVLTSPAPGSTLPGATATFSWTAGSGASQYYLYIGSLVGGADLYAASQGLSTSAAVTGLPTDGRTLYVRLWSNTSAGWQFSDYTYTAATVAAPAVLTSPAPGSTLPGATATFSWTTGSGVSQYYLYVGSSVAGTDIYVASQGLSTSATVTGLPTDGRTLYVRLWSLIGSVWQSSDYAYTAASVCHPLAGTHGQLSVPGSANSQYVYRNGWCTVGHGLPAQCFQGTYYLYQTLQSSYCSSVGSNGSCYDDDAWWWVTCDALVDCIYNCSGQCVKADC